MADRRREGYDKLAAALREIRRERGVSQTELAMRLGTFQERVSRIELAERRLDVIEFLDLVIALDVSAADVFDRAGLQHRP